MKRLFSFIMICVLSFAVFSVACAAASDTCTYELEELGISITLPGDYIVFTRDIDEDDPNLAVWGISGDSLYDYYINNNIFLDACDEEYSHELFVTMSENSSVDFNTYSDEMLTILTSMIQEQYEEAGFTYIGSAIYQHPQTKFIKVNFSQPVDGDTQYSIQYYTVYDGKAITVVMHYFPSEDSGELESALETIVNSVNFYTGQSLADTTEATDTVVATEAFLYTDSETGATFTVPENWTEEDLSEERQFIDTKFSSNLESGTCILYGSTDLWEEMSDSEKKGLSRADINNSLFTKEDIAQMFDVAASDVSTVTYGGYEYYKAETVYSSEFYGIEFEFTTAYLLRFENGYLYTFQLSCASGDSLYYDFEDLMNSVHYEQAEPVDSGASGGSLFQNVFFCLIITIIIYTLPILIYRYAVKKDPVEPKKAKKITIIYGIFAFVVMSALVFAAGGSGAAGGAIILWSYINYKILKKGYDGEEENSRYITFEEMEQNGSDTAQEPKHSWAPENLKLYSDEPEEAPSEDTAAEEVSEATAAEEEAVSEQPSVGEEASEPPSEKEIPEVRYCHKCGAKLIPGSSFCSYCGARVSDQ